MKISGLAIIAFVVLMLGTGCTSGTSVGLAGTDNVSLEPTTTSTSTSIDPNFATTRQCVPDDLLLQTDPCSSTLQEIDNNLASVLSLLESAYSLAKESTDTGLDSGIRTSNNNSFLSLLSTLQTTLADAQSNSNSLFTGTGTEITVGISLTSTFSCFSPNLYLLSRSSLGLSGVDLSDSVHADASLIAVSEALSTLRSKRQFLAGDQVIVNTLFSQITNTKELIEDRCIERTEDSISFTANSLVTQSALATLNGLKNIRDNHLRYLEAPFGESYSKYNTLLTADLFGIESITSITLFPNNNILLNGLGVNFDAETDADALLAAEYNLTLDQLGLSGISLQTDLTAAVLKNAYASACSLPNIASLKELPEYLRSQTGITAENYVSSCYPISLESHASVCQEISQTMMDRLQTVKDDLDSLYIYSLEGQSTEISQEYRDEIAALSAILIEDISSIYSDTKYGNLGSETSLFQGDGNVVNMTVNNEARTCLNLSEYSLQNINSQLNNFSLEDTDTSLASATFLESLIHENNLLRAKLSGVSSRISNYTADLETLSSTIDDYFTSSNSPEDAFVPVKSYCETAKQMAYVSLVQINTLLQNAATLASDSSLETLTDQEREVIDAQFQAELKSLEDIQLLAKFYDQNLLDGTHVFYDGSFCFVPLDASLENLNLDAISVNTLINADAAADAISAADSTIDAMTSAVEPP